MGQRSRRAGASWERRIVRWLATLGINADRSPAIAESIGLPGRNGVDVGGPNTRLAVQAKYGGRPNIIQALAEAEAGAQPGYIPLAMIHRTRQNGRPPATIVAMSPATFAALWSMVLESMGGDPFEAEAECARRCARAGRGP